MRSAFLDRLAYAATAIFAVAAATVTFPDTVSAQTGTGTIRGVVTTAETRAPIFGARVGIDQPPRSVATTAKGEYVLRGLQPGSYTVVITAIGREAARNTVTVVSGQSATLDIALKEGSLMLSSVVVSATRTPTEARTVASTINVLSAEHIQTSAARESQDLLREVPGVELPRTSSLVGGTAQIVSIRGVDEGRTVVLFDGVPIGDAWGEWIDWGRAPKSMLDRVEVVEGGTSNLYGNGAMGGVISFFSRPLAPGAVQVTLDGGSREARHASVSAGVPLWGAFTANVSGDYQSGGGYTMLEEAKRGVIDIPSQVIQRNGYLRLNYAPSAKLSAFVTGHRFGDSRATGTPLSRQMRDQQGVDLGFDYGSATTGLLGIRAWNGRQAEHQRSTAIRAGGRIAEDSSVVADIPSHDWGASASWTRTGVLHLESFSMGADFRHMQGAYDEFNFNTTNCPNSPCGNVLRKIWSGGDQSLSGAFVQAIAAPISPLRIELGARIDRWDNNNGKSVEAAGSVIYPDSSKTAFSPRLGARYNLTSSLSFHGAMYRSFRAPNLAELYRKQINTNGSQVTIPNPYLKAESADGREVGLDWQPFSWVQVKGTWYVADYKDFNVPTNIPNASNPLCPATGTCRQRQNVNKSRSEGGEAYIAIRPIQQLFISGSVNYDDARQQSGLPVTATDKTKPHINRVPSPKQAIRVTYASQLLGAWTTVWRHEGHTTTLQGAWLDPFTSFDVTGRRELMPGMNGFVAVDNVGNTKYQVNISGSGATALTSYGMPRAVRVGMELSRF